jgi:WD40 repeat protein
VRGVRIVLLLGFVALVAGCGSGSHVSSSDGRSMSEPAWSPNGARIAWEERTHVLARSVIWVANADGTDPHPVTQGIDALGQLQWLTNRELLVWANFRVLRLRLGSRPALVASNVGTDFSVDARGTRLASGSSDCPTCVSPITVNPLVPSVAGAEIGPSDVQNSSPSLAPDGRSVVFSRNLCSRAAGDCLIANGVWTAATSTGARARQLVRSGVCPAWSPRGNEIFYANETGYVVPASGGAARRLPIGENCATWSPDGQSLATIGADSRLAVVDLRTMKVRRLSAVGLVNGLAWSPDSRTLLVTTSGSLNACTSLWTVAVATGKSTQLRRCG